MKKIVLSLSLLSLTFASQARAQWSSDPMVNFGIAVKFDEQVQPKVRPTSDGGCYVSWFDNNPIGNPPFGYDVYLQRLDAAGVRQFAPMGIRLADLGMSSTQDYGFDVDAGDNALVAFLDDRRPGGAVTVTATRVSPAGQPLWGKKGVQVGRGPDFLGNPKIAATSDGYEVVGWIDNNDLKFQKLGRAGNKLWGADGITIAAPAGLTYSLADLHVGDNGSVVASWVSAAGFSGPKHLIANKIGPDGSLLWGANHVTVFDGGSLQFGNFPAFVTDGAGGAVFGWYQVSPLQSLAQHILADGSEAFPHNGVPGSTNTGHDQVNPSVSYDPATGSTYLFWDEILEGPLTNEGISGQKFDPAGVVQWGDFGLVVQPFTSSAVINVTSVFTVAGPLVVWSSEPTFGQDSIYGAKIDPNANIICPPFYVSSILSSKSRLDTRLSTNGVAFSVWSDARTDGGDIYGQDIKADCTLGQ